MMICEVIPTDMWEKIELFDRCEKETGGIAYVGETLGNFIAETELTPFDSFDELREAMIECDVVMKCRYIARHGDKPSALPPNVSVLHSEKIDRLRTLVVLDRPLSYEEKTFFDLSEVA